MENPPAIEYKPEGIEVGGTVSVELIEQIEEVRGTLDERTIILILGPTGAGKSTFIEVLDSKKSFKISSNQLEGFTQFISIYRLINATCGGSPIYLVDVPGFADTKISEMKIVSMLKDWMIAVWLLEVSRILYFSPVNNPRLPGSHRQVLRTVQAITGVETAESITVVSTMWDCVCNDTGRKRAESNFIQLRDEIWKEYVDNGTEILKFHNTQESALSILHNAFGRHSEPEFELLKVTGFTDWLQIPKATFGANLYNDLHTRIQNLHMQLANIESDLSGAREQEDTELVTALVPRLDEAQKLLAMFEQEMREFGPPLASAAPVQDTTSVSPQSETLAAASRTSDLPPLTTANDVPIVDVTSGAPESEIQEPASQTSDRIIPVPQTSYAIHHQPHMVLPVDPFCAPHTTGSPSDPQNDETIPIQATTTTIRRARLARVLNWMKKWIRKLRERLDE
ncbi:P-loop containing nucleoside triphosphate hydrolase protein [Panaeolus papilionaceus]|nr:P-loop containing nucleoside triphosphate hydrolase protein [Panaeolus papilionaceus]